MTYFFFGTLMDRDVLERVLDRTVSELELRPARVAGFDRVRTARSSYPTLVPRTGSAVDGLLLHAASRRDQRRIEHFEGEEYAWQWLTTRLPDGRPVRARVFFALAGMGQTNEPWHLADWTRMDKATFLEQCREWMRDCR